MSMPAEHDDTVDDDILQHVIGELRRPVRLDPSVDARALERIRAERLVGRGRPARRWGMWTGGAAMAAGLLLALTLADGPEPTAAPASPPGVAAGSGPVEARPVRLRLAAPSSSQVAVVGDFNDWDPAATPLRLAGDGGTWVVELRLKPGIYHYTFLIDGRRWERDPTEPPVAESDFGAPVSVLTVS
jgi:hypothetical protein